MRGGSAISDSVGEPSHSQSHVLRLPNLMEDRILSQPSLTRQNLLAACRLFPSASDISDRDHSSHFQVNSRLRGCCESELRGKSFRRTVHGHKPSRTKRRKQ